MATNADTVKSLKLVQGFGTQGTLHALLHFWVGELMERYGKDHRSRGMSFLNITLGYLQVIITYRKVMLRKGIWSS